MKNETWQFYALAVAVTVELIGIIAIGFGLFEMWEFGGNPVSPQILIPLGSVIIAAGGLIGGKLVKGLELRGADDNP